MTTQQYFRITEIFKRNNFADKDVEQLLGEVENIVSPLATKEDIKDIIEWIVALLSKDAHADIKEFLKEMNDYRRFLRAELNQSKVDSIKWMVALIVSQTAIIILYFMLHKP